MAPSKYKVIREAKAIWRRFAPFQRDYPNDDAHHERANSYMFRSRSRIPGLTGRRVFINIPVPHDYLDKHQNPKVKFPTNKIVTSKYNIFTFVPKNFFEQFRRVANLYFLIVAILQLVPIFGVGSPVFVVLPIITVIAITAVKDAVEDYRRQQADKEFNSTTTHTLSNWTNVNTPANPTSSSFVNFFKKPIVAISNLFSGSKQPSLIEGCSSLHGAEFQPTIWQDVKVGDIIHIAKDEPVPADILILSSDDPDGECYIETKNLDGETNLKTRNAIPETSYIQTPLDCSRVQGYVDTDHPSSNIYVFNGNFTIMESDNDDSRDASIFKTSYTDDVRMSNLPSQTIPFNNKNVLLRGHVLRNTPFVIGVVLFTGNDTKIMLNSGTTPSKRSKIEKTMNKQVGFNAFVLFLLSLCLALGYGITMSNSTQSQRDLFGFSGDSTLWQGFINFWASVILLQNIIPISLYVSIEVVKSFQALFIYSDLNMYYEPTDSPCIPKSWNLSDDLGQVQYLFSDKTGTLTRNVMEFKHCIINGKVYGKVIPGQETDVEKGLLRKQGGGMQERKGADKATMIKEHFHEMNQIFEPEYCEANEENITFCDADLYRDLAKDDEQSEEIKQFFLNLALCHTVLIEHNNKADSSSTSLNNNFVYRAESPDEKALVSAAKDAGFTFMNRSKTTMSVDILGKKHDFELLDVLEFNSTRKRTSVLIKRPAPWNDIVLFIKGADNVIIDRLHEGQDEIVEQTQKQINHFSNQGLRTLCLGYKILDEGECEEWRDRYKDALSSMDNRDKLVDQCCEDMETDLTLLGATAIEDKLQEGVPECIESLRAAGIRVWVLTGDKMETAINIGFACSLLNKDMKVYTVTNGNAEQVEENFFHIAEEIRNKEVHDGSDAIVIDGGALKHIVDRRKCLKTLVELAPIFGSVICCRTSPLQKAQVVHMIKKGYKAITLSIGDGANDVSMIQQAHVGVAIAGEEGLQASMASDYTISQFKFLSNLLLAHGQMSYHRISEMILCFFYKNMVWTVSAFWYQFYCLFSANLYFDYSLITLYNLVFTVATVVIMGGQDLPISYENYLKNPQIYKLGIKQRFFNTYIFFTYILDSLYQSLLCYYIYHLLNYSGVDNINGKGSSLYYQSSGTAVAIVIIANLFVGFHCRYWTWIMHFFTWLCIFLIFIFLPIYSMIFKENYYYIGIQVMQNANFWLAIPIAVVASLLPRYLNSYIRQTYYPNDLDIVRENQLIKKIQ